MLLRRHNRLRRRLQHKSVRTRANPACGNSACKSWLSGPKKRSVCAPRSSPPSDAPRSACLPACPAHRHTCQAHRHHRPACFGTIAHKSRWLWFTASASKSPARRVEIRQKNCVLMRIETRRAAAPVRRNVHQHLRRVRRCRHVDRLLIHCRAQCTCFSSLAEESSSFFDSA